MLSRSFVLLIGAALGLAIACSLADELEDAECESAADCARSQDCVVTEYLQMRSLPGLCRSKGAGCKTGEQAGCECDNSNGQLYCNSTLNLRPNSTNPAECQCEFDVVETTG